MQFWRRLRSDIRSGTPSIYAQLLFIFALIFNLIFTIFQLIYVVPKWSRIAPVDYIDMAASIGSMGSLYMNLIEFMVVFASRTTRLPSRRFHQILALFHTTTGIFFLVVGIVGQIGTPKTRWALSIVMGVLWCCTAVLRWNVWLSMTPILGAECLGYKAVPDYCIGWDRDRFTGRRSMAVRDFEIGRYDDWEI